LRILILEDNPADADLMLHALRPLGNIRATVADDRASFFRALHQDWDAIIADYNLHGLNALDVLNTLIEQGMKIPVIVCTGALGPEAEPTLRNLGASAYLLKDEMHRLPAAVRRAVLG
jgi:CheY-like chemotaxis protein